MDSTLKVWTGTYETWVEPKYDENATPTLVNIEGLDKAKLLKNLFYAASGDDNYDVDDEVEKWVLNMAKVGHGYMERFVGVLFKADFSCNMVNSYYYNQFTGEDNLFENIVAQLKKDSPTGD